MIQQKNIIFFLFLIAGVVKPASNDMLENLRQFCIPNRLTIASISAFLTSVEYDRKKQLPLEKQAKIGYTKYLKKIGRTLWDKGPRAVYKKYKTPCHWFGFALAVTLYEQVYLRMQPEKKKFNTGKKTFKSAGHDPDFGHISPALLAEHLAAEQQLARGTDPGYQLHAGGIGHFDDEVLARQLQQELDDEAHAVEPVLPSHQGPEAPEEDAMGVGLRDSDDEMPEPTISASSKS